MCDSLLFIDAGRIVHHGSAESLAEHVSAHAIVNVQVAGSPEALRNWVELNPGVTLIEMRKRGARLNFEADEPEVLAAVLKKMIADGLAVTEFHREARKLEDAFVDMLRKVDPSRPPPLPPPLPS